MPLAPSVRGRLDYVLILEWLDHGDRQTGAELYRYLEGRGTSAQLVICTSVDEIRGAIESAIRDVPRRGIPVIHIESHGGEPTGDNVQELRFGTNASDGLPWLELGEWLTPLNMASNFRLLVVGATCYGLGAIAAMQLDRSAPFAGCVGFTTRVGERDLLAATKEFYRSIISDGLIGEAIANAMREIGNPAVSLNESSACTLGLQILRQVRSAEQQATSVSKIIQQIVGPGAEPTEAQTDMVRELVNVRGRVRIEEVWNAWFPADVQQRYPEYRLNWSLIEPV